MLNKLVFALTICHCASNLHFEDPQQFGPPLLSPLEGKYTYKFHFILSFLIFFHQHSEKNQRVRDHSYFVVHYFKTINENLKKNSCAFLKLLL